MGYLNLGATADVAPFFGLPGSLSLCYIRQNTTPGSRTKPQANTLQTRPIHISLGDGSTTIQGGGPTRPRGRTPAGQKPRPPGGGYPGGRRQAGACAQEAGSRRPARRGPTERRPRGDGDRRERWPAPPDARKGPRATHTGRPGNMPRRRAPGMEEKPRGRMARQARERG